MWPKSACLYLLTWTGGQLQKVRGLLGSVFLALLSVWPQNMWLFPWLCLTQVSRRAPYQCSCLGLVCLVSQQCWTDSKCKFSMREEHTVGQKCVGGDFQNSTLGIIILLLRTIFHVLFTKSFECLLVKVPNVPKDCSSSACYLGHPTLESNSPAVVLKVKRMLNLQQLSMMWWYEIENVVYVTRNMKLRIFWLLKMVLLSGGRKDKVNGVKKRLYKCWCKI